MFRVTRETPGGKSFAFWITKTKTPQFYGKAQHTNADVQRGKANVP
jgi:hypothetical protein